MAPQGKRKPCEEIDDGVVRAVSPRADTGDTMGWLYQQFHIGNHTSVAGIESAVCASVTQCTVGEGAGQSVVEGGSLGDAAVVQGAGVGFVVQGTSNESEVSIMPGDRA